MNAGHVERSAKAAAKTVGRCVMIERAIMGYTADVGAKNVLALIRGGEER